MAELWFVFPKPHKRQVLKKTVYTSLSALYLNTRQHGIWNWWLSHLTYSTCTMVCHVSKASLFKYHKDKCLSFPCAVRWETNSDWQMGRGHPVNSHSGQGDIKTSFTGQAHYRGDLSLVHKLQRDIYNVAVVSKMCVLGVCCYFLTFCLIY